MKRIIAFFLSAFAITGAIAQTTAENFNSRPEAELSQVKAYLQNHCWQFHDMDINNGGWDPAIEGDGALISGSGATATQNTGILSPALSFNGTINVSFKYKFSANVTDRRWLKIYSADQNNNIIDRLDSIELTGSNNTDVYSYNNTLPAGGSGCYKIFINYAGEGGENRIAIDDILFGAATCFANGCNQPPVAINDFFGGASNYSAIGKVTLNDSDPENSVLTATLVTNSPDGNVVLQENGDFTFTANPGFNGMTTSFTYIVCDPQGLCSDPATVLITFQSQGALPVKLIDFIGSFNNDDDVILSWASTFEVNNDRFEIERSTDGAKFEKVGTVKGLGNNSGRHDYNFTDQVSKNMATRNDLYYRLKQIDLNGTSSYTKTLVVRYYGNARVQSLSVTPNPAINDIMVVAQVKENSYAVIKVVGVTGTEIMRKTTRLTAGTNKFRLEGTSKLPPGIYMLEVIVNSKERMNVKLVKQ